MIHHRHAVVLLLREGEHIPLHDHPEMHGIIKCLAGSLKITSYTKLPITSLPTNLPDKMKESTKIQEKLKCGNIRVCCLHGHSHEITQESCFWLRSWIQQYT